jgi:hypothetical protein
MIMAETIVAPPSPQIDPLAAQPSPGNQTRSFQVLRESIGIGNPYGQRIQIPGVAPAPTRPAKLIEYTETLTPLTPDQVAAAGS